MRPSNDARVQLLAELADETRYAVLERLEQGPASASELAERLGVSPTRLANHLRRLRDAGLVAVSHQGRLALYELAEPGLREIFSMLNGLRGAPPRTGRPVRAATCYDHLAGQIGVALMDHLVQSRALAARDGEGELKLGPAAARGFAQLGVELPTKPARRTLAFSCMDPRIGRPHLGGQLGAQLAASLHQKGWVKPTAQPRRLELTPAGNKALHRLGIRLEAAADHPTMERCDERAMSTPWDARTYDVSSAPQQAWAKDVLSRLDGIAPDATILDVGCGTGRVTESLLALVPAGRVLAIDADLEMVELARARLGDRADVWCQDVLELELAEPVDVVVSTAALHWVTDHARLWQRLAAALRPAGILEVQCGGAGNIARVREVIQSVARDTAPELVGWSPWEFASAEDTERRLRQAGFASIRCWLQERPTYPQDVGPFVRTSILAAHIARLPEGRRDQFTADVLARVRLPLDYVRLNISAIRTPD